MNNIAVEPTEDQKTAKHMKQARKQAHSRRHKPPFQQMSEMPMEMGSRKCGTQIPASEMGLRQSPAVEQVFSVSLLQANASGPGGDQDLAEGGASGSVGGQEV